jgi:hypothetical protein
MTANTALPAPRVPLAIFCCALIGIWALATVLVFVLAWFVRQLFTPMDGGLLWFLIPLFFFPLFHWLAGARWPASSQVSRFGFALGSSAVNCVLALCMAFVVGTLVFGG